MDNKVIEPQIRDLIELITAIIIRYRDKEINKEEGGVVEC